MTGYEMDISIRQINSENDTCISILLYIKDNVSLEQEITRVKSNGQTDIVLNQYFQNSPDFQRLVQKVVDQKEKVALLSKDQVDTYRIESLKLEQFNHSIRLFKESALRLAGTFLRITTQSQRLMQARNLFDQGRLREADNLLIEEEMLQDQASLLAQLTYFKQRKQDLFTLLG